MKLTINKPAIITRIATKPLVPLDAIFNSTELVPGSTLGWSARLILREGGGERGEGRGEEKGGRGEGRGGGERGRGEGGLEWTNYYIYTITCNSIFR